MSRKVFRDEDIKVFLNIRSGREKEQDFSDAESDDDNGKNLKFVIQATYGCGNLFIFTETSVFVYHQRGYIRILKIVIQKYQTLSLVHQE